MPARKSQMFATPMNWTRIKETSNAPFQRVAIYDVEADVNSDKALKQVRRDMSRSTSTLLFDPE